MRKMIITIIVSLLLVGTSLASELSEKILNPMPENQRIGMENEMEKVCNGDPSCIEKQYERFEKITYVTLLYMTMYGKKKFEEVMYKCCIGRKDNHETYDYKYVLECVEKSTGIMYEDVKRIRGNSDIFGNCTKEGWK